MSEVTRMYELLYEERWDEKAKGTTEMKRHFSPESPITREIQSKNCLMFLMPVCGISDAVQFWRHWCIASLNRSSAVL